MVKQRKSYQRFGSMFSVLKSHIHVCMSLFRYFFSCYQLYWCCLLMVVLILHLPPYQSPSLLPLIMPLSLCGRFLDWSLRVTSYFAWLPAEIHTCTGFHTGFWWGGGGGRSLWGAATALCMSMRLQIFKFWLWDYTNFLGVENGGWGWKIPGPHPLYETLMYVHSYQLSALFLSHLVTACGDAVFVPLKGLVQHICTKTPDRAEYRSRMASVRAYSWTSPCTCTHIHVHRATCTCVDKSLACTCTCMYSVHWLLNMSHMYMYIQ